MSEMSYLEKLLDGVEVEWKAVGDIAGYSTTKVDADKLDATSFVGVDNLLADKGGRIDATYQPNTARLTAYEPGDILLGNIRPYLKKVWMAENNGGCSGDVLAIRILADCKKIISPEYLYYALSSDSFFSYSMQHAKGAKMPRGSKDAILNYHIPIPCPSAPGKSLAIQSEIVRILDKFTALTAELTAELNIRKKQYNYYRDKLLSFEEDEVEWKTLGEIAKIQRGASPRPIAQYMTDADDGIPWIKIGDTSPDSKYINGTAQKVTPDGAKKSRILNPGDFVISNSMSFGRPYILSITGAIHDGWASISDFSERLDSDYLYHYLSSQRVKNYWGSKINSGSVSNLNADIIKTLPLPLPDIQKQKWIATLLDKFDTLTSSISEGIPREIELRQKQYEYYRDLLFSFPKSEAASN
ncbi:TPA: restriction endonuclease subunit S [Klebsiella pneumoniae subsp. pneumoniae]|nr:restriction endonuclease subunit S [Klebsiella pneumoniae subsp. pneumoniae]